MVDLWCVRTSASIPRVSFGRWGGSVIGNDAVIVAHRVKHMGMAVSCVLIQPTNADLKIASRVIGGNVVGIGTCRGALTRSLCIEGANGSRRWIMSRHLSPSGDLESRGATILYLDYYPELREFLNRAAKKIRASDSSVFVNLSDTSTIADVPRLPFAPTVLQASIGTASSRKEVFQLCSLLRERTGTKYVFVTMGQHGAALETSAGRWYSKPPVAAKASVLGSGAIFSAEAIVGLLRGVRGHELLEQVVRNTAASLRANEGHSPRGNKRIG
jgi:hypothetical protein